MSELYTYAQQTNLLCRFESQNMKNENLSEMRSYMKCQMDCLQLHKLLSAISLYYLIRQEGTSRQRSGKGAIRKRFPLQKPRWEKTKLTIRYLYHETYRKPNEQLFSQ